MFIDKKKIDHKGTDLLCCGVLPQFMDHELQTLLEYHFPDKITLHDVQNIMFYVKCTQG